MSSEHLFKNKEDYLKTLNSLSAQEILDNMDKTVYEIYLMKNKLKGDAENLK